MKIFDDLDKTRENEKKHGRGVDAAVIKKLKDSFFVIKRGENSVKIIFLFNFLIN